MKDTLVNHKLTHGSLFSGIGGFEVGAERLGIRTVWSCEINKKSRKILKKHFPKTTQYEDIRKTTMPGYVDIISVGFPCTDISKSGKMEGIHGDKSKLWFEANRIVCEVLPKYIIIENVPTLAIRGLETVLANIAKAGYDAEWQTISNASFGYPHARQRLYIIAYPSSERLQENVRNKGGFKSIFKSWTSSIPDAYSLSKRVYEMSEREFRRNDNGFRDWSFRINALGNAVNPTIAEYLFDCIIEFDTKWKA